MSKIARRKMLKTIGGISLGGFIPPFVKASEIEKKDKKSLEPTKTDILVIGGGTAGVVAAIQAAEAGCATTLLESGSQLGGTTTTGGVAFPGLFHAWGKQVIAGIGWELVTDAVQQDDGVLPDFSIPTGRQHWRHQIRINPYLYTLLAEDRCLQAGIEIRYYETPFNIQFKNGNWEVETIGKGTHTKIVANQIIDCTGNALVASMAGYKVLKENETQPGTLMFRIDGYDTNKLDYNLIRSKYNEAIKNSELEKEEFRDIVNLLKSHGDNVQHIAGADSTTSVSHSITNIKGRSSLLKHLKFLRSLPGCEKTRLTSMQPETAVRETYRIDGEYQITHEDYVSGKLFDDAVCYAFYPIDLHDKNGVKPKHLEENTVATVPLRALIPKNSRNFLVAGRCVSSDRLANSALRVQASCMAMGQAAGAAAALACLYQTTPKELSIDKIGQLLKQHGGIVPS